MPRPRRFKAQAFDILQYFYGTAHEPVIHCRISCAGTVDASILKKAVTLSMDAVPLIRCCFDDASRRPRWLERPFSGEDVVHAVGAGSDEAGQISSCLTSAIDIRRGPQLSIYLVRGHNADTLCVIMNHMICDGAGFKDYLYLLAELYTGLERDAEYSPELQSGPRNAGQLFAGMNMREKLKILFSKYANPAQERQTGLNLEGNNNDPFIATRRIEPEDFRRIKAYAKNASSTVNDMALTAYVRLLSKKTGKDRLVLPCPVDLRRYIRGDRRCGICNLTSNLICDVAVEENDSFRDTLAQITYQMTAQKESTVCLKSIIMLEFVCRALSFRTIRKHFGKLFKIPVISYTNLGVIDAGRIRFGKAGADDVFMTGAIKYVPYFQLAVSTFNGACTLSCNMHGTEKDRVRIEDFLEETARELAEIPSP